jgi:hypothetical protein
MLIPLLVPATSDPLLISLRILSGVLKDRVAVQLVEINTVSKHYRYVFFDAVDNCGGDENDKSVVIITSGITFICFRTKPYIQYY